MSKKDLDEIGKLYVESLRDVSDHGEESFSEKELPINSDSPRIVQLKIESGPEVYYGNPTGKTQWSAYSIWEGEDSNRWGGVLGRSTRSAEDAVTNWNFRAKLDGHNVKGVVSN